ncbi:hypothetical protein [Bradyrhizobium sp. B120]|uniref:hypothetical protein n=1 Tax=Bradyrhizobium sp. B120 TaxID=3410088 RepID=UPI003B987FBD
MDFIYFRTDDAVAAQRAAEFLPEGRQYTIDNKWSVRVDNPHTTGMQKHSYIQLKWQEIAVAYQDGTPSHGSDLSKVPSWVLDKAKGAITESFVVVERVPAAVIAEPLGHELTVQQAVENLSKTSRKQ